MSVAPNVSQWDGRVVVVTGGGSGIGRATAVAFATRGTHVVITGRRAERLAEVAGENPLITPVTADVSDPTDAERVVDAAVSRWGRLDALVNNAGVFAAMPLAEIDPQRVSDLLAVNVLGPTLLTRAALPQLRTSRGAVVNVSSCFGARPAAGAAHYAATKAALDSLTRSWALELAGEGVRVNAVAPGPTESEALQASGLAAGAVEQIKQDEAGRIPLGRRGEPDEIARWVLAMAAPDASWVTGQVLTVDGGLTLT